MSNFIEPPLFYPVNPITIKRLLFFAGFALSLFLVTLALDGQIAQWMASNSSKDVGSEAEVTIERSLLRPYDLSEYTGDDKTAEVEPITMVAFGDLMLGRYVWTLMEQNGHDYPFEYFPELLASMLEGTDRDEPDILFANLEGPISDSSYVNPGTAMRFNFKPIVTLTIKKYGFNLLSIANNHAFDMGEEGEEQTREYLDEADINHVGNAQDVNDQSFWITEVNDMRITFLGFNDTVSDHLDYEEATELIRSAAKVSDFTVVSIHWGREYYPEPTQAQVDHGHGFVDAGADIILGHHSHVIGEREWYEGPNGPRPIYYSLGNFIFDQYFQANVQEGLGLTITFEKALKPGLPNTVSVEETIFDITVSQVKERE